MKLKRQRDLVVPPKIRLFISYVTATPLESIDGPLRSFIWDFDKGDFHHWIDLFNHFDSFFEKHIKSRKDLQDENFSESDPPFPKEAVLQILRVIRIILENCSNKHFFNSYEQHLSSLLASTDADVIEACLETLAAFLKKTIGSYVIRDSGLRSKLFTFAQGWGGKEEGLGLVRCATENGSDQITRNLGSTLHFEFYPVNDTTNEFPAAERSAQGLQIIHLPNVNTLQESDIELLSKLVRQYNVPRTLRFSLLTRLRFARAFSSLASRQQYTRIRLYAFIVLIQACSDTDNLTSFFNNEPEFINELVTLLSYEDAVLEKIQTLSLLSLIALCQVPSRHPTVLIAVTSGGHRGILSSLVQKAVDSVSNFSKSSVVFAEALLSFVIVLVSSSSGSSAMREAGFVPALLPLLKDTDPQHLHLVSIALHVVEAFMDISNPAAALFQDLGGLDDTISRLKVEVSHIENGTSIMRECTSSKLYSEQQPLYSEALVESHRRSLMKALLRVVSLVTYAPGSTARIYGSEENLLPHSLCIILRRAKDFGGGVFSLAATLMSDLIQNDPACFPILEASGLPSAFLDAILVDDGVLCSAEAIACIPQCLEAVCLSNNGLRAVKDRNALRCFVKIFTSRMHLPVLTGDTTGAVSRSLDELMRHSPSLRGPAVDMLIEILNIIAELGSGPEPALLSNGTPSCSTPVPMETEESFLPEYIRNATRLAGTILQNSETCRIFVEKKGAEAVLRLFTLPLIPLSVSLDQSISAAFKNFSHQHSMSLARAVCSSLRDHLKLTTEYLVSVGGTQLAQLEEEKRTNLLRCLSSLKGILSLSNSLLKVTAAVISILGTADVNVLKDLGRAYREILWQISLCGDLNVEENPNNAVDYESTNADVSTATGMGSDDDLNIPVVGYRNNPFFSLRNSSHPRRGVVRNFLTVLPSGEGLRFSTRRGVARLRGGRTGRHLGALHIDSEVSTNNVEFEPSSSQHTKKKSPEVVVLEILNQLASTLRSFFVSLAKGSTSVNRRRIETGPLSSALKNMGSALAKVFLEALGFSGYPTSVGLDMSLSVKCHYLGKVVDDMMALTYDSKRGTCHTAMVNNFYVSGTFKELLTTFEATSQLLWTLPPVPAFAPEESDGSKLSHNSWLFKTLMSYCRVLEYFVNSVVLLSSQAQLLVQPVTDGSSIALFPVPRDPEVFVRLLQSQVLDVILPVWNHPMFLNFNSKFIILIVSLLTHVYSGVGDVKINHNSVPGVSINQRLVAPPPDEATIATIVEMGFTRARAEEALSQVRTNRVEVAMEWLFTHPEDPVQENDELAQALALSLESSPEMSKVEITDKPEDGQLKVPSLDDTLAAITRLFQTSEALNYPLRNLLVTICNRNKGEDRARVISYLVEQLKLCPWEFTKDSSALCMISNTLALLFAEDEKTREIAARDGIVTVVVDILTNFKSRNGTGNGLLVPKCINGLLLILDNLLQCRPKIPRPSENSEGNITFENIFGKSTGYLAEESGRVLVVACELMKQQVPVVGALLPLCARLTKTHALALQFLEIGGLAALLSIQDDTTVASAIIRHLIEDPKTLQNAMELEIRQTLTGNRHAGRVLVQEFLTTMAPVISRDPEVFMKAAAAVCQLESSGGRTVVLLSKQKEREKVKGHKKVPANLSLVIDQLLQILLRYPSPKSEEGFTSAMEIDEPMTKVKGKSKVGETRKTIKSDNNTSEKPAGLAANVTFVLKLLSDILLMYVHVVGVILKRDLELYQVRGFGILHHVMRRLVPLSTAGPDEWTVELSEKASLFLVVLCGRSSEGRTRVISELVKALSSLSNLEINSSKSGLLPNKKVLSFVDLVYSILSKNPSSSNLPGTGYSPDVAKSMIDGGVVQCLSDILQVIDLDHPDAPKVVNLILKALETLTRAANASEQLVKPETLNKEKLVGPGDDQVNATLVTQTIDPDHNHGQDLVNDAAGTDQQPEGTTAHHESGLNSTNPNQSSDQDMGIEAEDMVLMHDEVEDDGVTRNTDPIEMTFHVENSGDVDMGEEEDEEEDVANDGGALMSLADTDVEDHFGLGDDYNEDEDEDEDEDDAEDDDNGVLGVRWREALDGVDDHLQVLGQQSGLDVAAEPFESLETLFGQSQQPVNLDTLLSSPSDVSGDLEALPAGSSGVAQFDMFDAAPVPGNTLDDRIRHALQSPLTDFSVGRVPGQRTSGDGRWTDDGHPQVGGQAAAVAQAVLEHFIDLLRVNAPPPINNPAESRPHESESPEKHVDGPLADASQIALEVDNGRAQQSEVQEENPDVVEGASEDLQAQEPMSEVSFLETSNPGPVDCHGDDIDMEENQTGEPLPSEVNGEEPSSVQNPMLPQDAAGLTGETGLNNEDPDTNGLDPTFLEALPEDLRAEVLASQQARPAQPPTNAPEPTSAEEIDPEFLAALPPEIQAEVLAQQRAQRVAQQAAGQPVEMDNASIIATFPAELREEVLLTSSQAVLQALPSSLLAEAQMLRDRAMSNYEARSGLFGSGRRLHNRTSGLDFSRQTGTTRRFAAPLIRMSSLAGKLKDIEGEPLMDSNGLKALIRLLRLAQPLGKGLLQRLFLNLSAHSRTRATLVHHLLDMVKPETEGSDGITNVNSQRLYGCQSNVVYGRSQLLDGLPPLVLRRVLEIMTFLATNHSAVANILFYRDPSLVPDYLGPIQVITNDKGKEKIGDLGSSQEGDVPVILLLKLLGRPLVLRSNAHLEQVMGLLQAVVFAAASKLDRQSHSEQGAATSSQILSGNEEVVSGTQEDSPVLERESVHDDKKPNDGVSTSDGQENTKLYDIFLQLPQSDLHNLCSLLGHEGLSDKVYLLVCEVVKKLGSVAAPYRKFFILELSDLAHSLSSSAVSELTTLRNTQMLGLNAGSMAGAATLRVLQTLGSLTSSPNNDGEQEEHATLWKLNMSLDPLWEELSNCISPMETKLVSQSALSSNMSSTNGRAHIINGSASPSSPLPVGTQRLLPFIEAFFVLCEKLQAKNPIMQQDHEVKEFSGSLELFIRFTEKHRRLLNAFIRQNPTLLQKSLTMMLKAPRLIDFDNKRAYFRSRIRQHHERTSRPLRISVRRAYLLEDSYNQLRMRPAQDLKGRLNVHFQGEEGIDAGGLTREWYQSLSRVIFDKGALLFTTGGNNATFQPNPNSVFQTEHLSYFKFVGRLVSKALFDGQLLDVYFTRSFYKHILGVKVTYHDIEAVDPDYYKNLKWMLENDVSEIPDLTFSMDADEEKHILYEKTEVSEYELKPGGGNIRVTEETKHEYVDLVAEHILTNAIRPQINSFLEGFNELIPRELISIFNDKELELLISGLPEIDLDDLKANTEYTGYMAASNVVQWFWEVVKVFNKEDTARFLQFVTGTSKVPLEGFKALQGISGPQKFQVHKAYGAPERLPSAHTCFNQLDLPEYTTKEQLEERLLLAIHEASEGFGFG